MRILLSFLLAFLISCNDEIGEITLEDVEPGHFMVIINDSKRVDDVSWARLENLNYDLDNDGRPPFTMGEGLSINSVIRDLGQVVPQIAFSLADDALLFENVYETPNPDVPDAETPNAYISIIYKQNTTYSHPFVGHNDIVTKGFVHITELDRDAKTISGTFSFTEIERLKSGEKVTWDNSVRGAFNQLLIVDY